MATTTTALTSPSSTEPSFAIQPLFSNTNNEEALIDYNYQSSDYGADYNTSLDDLDTRIILAHLSAAASSSGNYSVNDLIAKFRALRPAEPLEIIFLIVSTVGWLLNVFLFSTLLCCRREKRIAPVLSQRPFVAILAFSHITLCTVHLGEFFMVSFNLAEAWMFCLQFLKRRTVTNLCDLLIIGAVFACAVDNYIAVCHSRFHRFERPRIKTAFVILMSIYCSSAVILAFSDFIFPLNIDPQNCPEVDAFLSSSNNIEGQENSSSYSQKVMLPFFLISSSAEFQNYCQMIEDCQLMTPVIEWTVLIVWATSASFNCFFYIKTAIVLRRSYDKFCVKDANSSTAGVAMLAQRIRTMLAVSVPSPPPEVLTRSETMNGKSGNFDSSMNETFDEPPSFRLKCDPTSSNNPNEEGIAEPPSSARQPAHLPLSPQRSFYTVSSVASFSSRSSTFPDLTARRNMRRDSQSQRQQMQIYRSRCRASATMIIILVIFIITWGPVVFFQLSNAIFFTESFRIDVLPALLPIVRYFYLLVLLNAIIDPIVYCYGAPRAAKRFLAGFIQGFKKH